MNRSKNKIYEIARSNTWEWFVTLTFNPQIVNSKFYEPARETVSDFFHSMRKRFAPDLKYLVVPELHSDGEKFHFHGLLADTGAMPFSDSGHGTPDSPVYNLSSWHFGFSTATRVKDTKKVSGYITKYITKDLCAATMDRRRYLNSANCARPKVTEYSIGNDGYGQILDDLSGNIVYMKSIAVPQAYNKVEYVEVTD